MTLQIYEVTRAKRIIDGIISKLSLDLKHIRVLTEVGSGYYLFTPIIAALAGAEIVYAWTRDSRYGNGRDLVSACDDIAQTYCVPKIIEYAVNTRPEDHVKDADIITNSGFIRPLNKELLRFARDGKTVIPLMFELWELRSADLDLDYCKEKKIKVGGTWENHPDLNIFNACGSLAIKMAHEAGYEVYGNEIIVWSDDQFGNVIENAFLSYGAHRVIKTVSPDTLLQNIQSCDFIFFCDYDEQRSLIGEDGLLDAKMIAINNPSVGVVHLYGKIDPGYLIAQNLNIYPINKGLASAMSLTLAHLGMIPVLQLQAAGLKVGECMLKNISNDLVQF